MLAAFPGLDWLIQLLLFAAFSVLALVVGRRFFRHHPIASDRPTLNRRGHQYIGRAFTLDRPILNGAGRLRVDDTIWKISGPDCPAGTQVKVSGVDGVILRIERVGTGD
jgi:membrane protein implicated in regulation of membrane protease activity